MSMGLNKMTPVQYREHLLKQSGTYLIPYNTKEPAIMLLL